jgi:starch-binding outer membrane protein, SusD/RagB family
MKTNRFLVSVCLSLLTGLVLSCTEVEEKVYSQNTPGAFFGSKSDVDAALAGIYKPLAECCGGPGQAGTFILNSVSDEGNAQIFWGDYDRLTYTPTGPNEIGDHWNTLYLSIARANFVISNQAKIEANSAASAKAAIGEAKFMRAANYFQLVRMWGGVPLRTKQVERLDEVNIPRSTETEVYAQIIKDLTDAEQSLPATNVAGKPTKWAASAYLAKVYLTTKDYTKALAKADEVIAAKAYNIIPSYGDVFSVDKKNNAEVIFAIQYLRQDGLGMRLQPLVLGPDDKFASGAQGGWGLSYVEDGFYKKYRPTDDRINTAFANPLPGLKEYHTGKWKDPQGVSADGHGNDFIMYRYADLLLIQSEAANELNGPTAAAYSGINQVRARAKLPALTTGLTKDQFREAVLLERHLELSWEQHRWFDLKRTGLLKTTLTAIGKTWNDRYLLFPIPQREIDLSNGVIKQNPGY